jgi:hypothetical protein
MRRCFAATVAVAGMICCSIASDGWGQTADPVYANSFETGLIALGPPLNEVYAGAVSQQTTGTPLRVTLSAPSATPTFVSILSADPSTVAVTGGGVTIPAGEISAPVLLSAPFIGTSPPVTLWATLGNTVGAAVFVSYPESSCLPGTPSDMSGYTRQCSGYASNYQGDATWDNTYATLFGGAWPGSVGQVGHSFRVQVNATQYGSFLITTGTTAAGVHIYPNNSFGDTGLISISTEAQGPGFFPTGLCYGADLTISSKPGTVARCKLSANSTYYLNFSMASFFPPYTTTCGTASCLTGWTFDQYGN